MRRSCQPAVAAVATTTNASTVADSRDHLLEGSNYMLLMEQLETRDEEKVPPELRRVLACGRRQECLDGVGAQPPTRPRRLSSKPWVAHESWTKRCFTESSSSRLARRSL